MGNELFKWAALALFLLFLGVGLYVSRPCTDKLTRVTVVGNSEAKVAPNTAVVSFSVVTESPQAVSAQKENARKSEAVQAAVEALAGQSKIEVKTSGYSLHPEYNYDTSPAKIKGYSVRNTVTVSIDDMKKVGDLIDAATAAGANTVEGIQFVVGQDSPAQGEALTLATKQATAKAEAIAAAMNGRIVRIVQTTEGGIDPEHVKASYENKDYSASANTSASARTSTPITAGSTQIRSQVVLIVDIAVS